MTIKDIIDGAIKREGGYTFHPSDRGGPTNWGITAVTLGQWRKLPRAATAEEVSDMPIAEARAIYYDRYVRRPGFSLIAEVSMPVAEEVIDSGVNFGPSVPGVWLQRWLTALNRMGRDYPDLTVDGRVGPVTTAALAAFLRVRGDHGERVLVTGLNCSQGARYLELAEARGSQESFLYGWVSGRVLTTTGE